MPDDARHRIPNGSAELRFKCQVNCQSSRPTACGGDGFKDIVLPGRVRLERVQQAHLVLGTIKRFCQSDGEAIARDHVPRYGRLLGIPDDLLWQVQGWAVGEATALWTRMIDGRDDVPLGYDGYLKLWALRACLKLLLICYGYP
jgi:hypothetical protein